MEKSLRKAEITKTNAPRKTAPKLAIPARRAVSPSRSAPGCLIVRAARPARNEYPLRARASRRTKLPSSAMMQHSFFQNYGEEANVYQNPSLWKPQRLGQPQ